MDKVSIACNITFASAFQSIRFTIHICDRFSLKCFEFKIKTGEAFINFVRSEI